MQNSVIIEAFTIILCNLKEPSYKFEHGLCHEVDVLFRGGEISEEEFHGIKYYLESVLPEATHKGLFFPRIYCWPMGNRPERIAWLELQLEKL